MSYSFGWIEIHCVDHCSNSCRYCNNHSPYAQKREYQAEEYIPWIDRLIQMGIRFYCLSLMGAEPFLHSDINRFVDVLRKRYDQSLMISTNGFWLSEANIEKYASLLEKLDILCVSVYPNIPDRVGGLDLFTACLEQIRKKFSHLRLDVRNIERFNTFEFLTQPAIVNRYCGLADCTCLLADGRMARCGVGAFAHMNPTVTQEFMAAGDMFYDLNDPHEDFWLWRKRWPMKSCNYCTQFKNKSVPWEYTKRIPLRLK